MKRKGKVTAIILIFCLLMTQISSFAYAELNDSRLSDKSRATQNIIQGYEGYISAEQKTLIALDMDKLDKMGLLSDYNNIIINEGIEDEKTMRSYVIDFDGVSNTIEMLEETEEYFTLKITEDSKVNIYTETKAGEIFIDGEKVEFSIEESIPTVRANDLVMPLATETWFQESCPYGAASDYTHKQTSLCYNKYEVKFNIALQKLTFSAFKSSLVKSVVSSLGITGAKKFASEKILGQLVKYNPESKSVSYSIDLYTHKNYTSGFISPIITRVWKYNYKYYATANLTGDYATEYEFKCQM